MTSEVVRFKLVKDILYHTLAQALHYKLSKVLLIEGISLDYISGEECTNSTYGAIMNEKNQRVIVEKFKVRWDAILYTID